MYEDPNSTPGTGTEAAASPEDALLAILNEDGGDAAGGEQGTSPRPKAGSGKNAPESDGDLDDGAEDEGEAFAGESEPGEGDEEDEPSQLEWDADEVPDDLEFKIQGKPVTLHELKRGFLRESDYTRKTQALADQRRAAEAEVQALRAERAQAHQLAQQAQQLIQSITPQEPNWQELYAKNPSEYAAQRELWRSWKEQQQQLTARQQMAQQANQANQVRELQKQLQVEQQRLMEAIPAWKDEAKATAEKQRILAWGQRQGYSADELGSIVDHRALVVARKAMLYDELVSRRDKAQSKKAPARTAPPSRRHKAPKGGQRARAQERLAKSGSVDDAAALLFETLQKEA